MERTRRSSPMKNQLYQILGLLWLFLLGCGNVVEIVPFEENHAPLVVAEVPLEQRTVSATPAPNSPQQLIIDRIGLNASVTPMGWSLRPDWNGEATADWDIPYSTAGWHLNSGLPGQVGNILVSGHNASLGGKVFARLEELEVGDELRLRNSAGQEFVYRIVGRQIIRALLAGRTETATMQRLMAPTSNEQLTLITCWPSWSNTHRLFIIAERVR